MKWNDSLASRYLMACFLPLVIAVLLILGFNFISGLYQIQKDQSHYAFQHAEQIAIVAAQRQNPFHMDLMSQQVNAIIKNAPTVVSINFYPLSQPLPESANQESLFDSYLSRNAAVMVKNNDNSSNLIGYINVTMDLKKARGGLVGKVLTQFIVMLAVLLCLFFVLHYSFSGSASLLKHVTGMSRKVMEGQYDVSLLEHQRSHVKEMRIIEDAMLTLSTKVNTLTSDVETAKANNELLVRREQTLNHRQMTFQSLVTHELRTPLNAISGGLQLLETQELPVTIKDSLSLIQQGHNRLSGLLDNIIELNNLQQGNIVLSEQRFNPERLLHNLAEKYSQACLQKGLQLSVDIKHTAVELLGDKDKILQVLSYLVDNAVKFTEQGTITLVSRVMHTKEDVLQWQCDVEDTGIGIDSSMHRDIFNAYVQADSGRSRHYEGSGLGLTLASKMAELISGQLSVSSELDKGSVFRLLLNMQDAKHVQLGASLHGLKFLHLHSGVSGDFAKSLTKMGATAYEFSEVQRARSLIFNEKVDLVTICAQMTPEQAVYVASDIREQEFLHRSIIVYFVSEEHEFDEVWLSSAGIDYLLVFTSLDDVVRQFMEWLDYA